jgi:GAF domain-containing protein
VSLVESEEIDQATTAPAPGVSVNEDGSHLIVPIIVHHQVLGGIHLHREKGEPTWTDEELRVVEQAILQIGPALENARLLEEAQTRAAREQTVNVIATQVRNAAGIQAILQNTVRELGKALGVSRTFIQFGVEPTTENMEDS